MDPASVANLTTDHAPSGVAGIPDVPVKTPVQARLTLVVASAAALTVLALVLSQLNETRQIDAVLAADAKEHAQLLDRTLELAGGSLATFARDYSLWGEMVQFVQTRDRTWANVNIAVGIGTYQANAAWVFDTTGALVYEVRDSILEPAPEPLPPGFAVKNMFGDGHFCHFFIAGPDGPVEIRGATIQPSDDDERKTPARGYFLAARSWNREYLAGLTRLTGKTMAVGPARDGAKPTAEIARRSGQITFIRPLPAPHGKPEFALTAILRPDWIAAVERSGEDLFGQLAVIALLEILGLWLALLFWVTRPLGLLRRSLQSGSAKLLKPLERSRTEFGQLAQLVGQFFRQNAALVKEVTERKHAEDEIARKNAQLVDLNDLKNQLLGMAAHDLRNPLSVVTTASAFLLDDQARLLPEGKRADFIRRINTNGEFMLKLIDDLLDVAKIESGRLDLKLATGDICGLIEENLTMNRMLAEKKGIRLDFAAEHGLPPLRFDRGKVEQVLNNLISNALKFSAPGTAVTVRASRANDNVVVSVRDHGQGIPTEELDRLFKPFGKTTVRGTAGEKSTGLGLAICRKIVEGHGGVIWAESELDKGSTFSFSLPVNATAKIQALNPKP